MLYTRFVIGEETLSSTSAFSFSQWASFSTSIKSFISGPFNGHYRKLRHKDSTSGQAETSSRISFCRAGTSESVTTVVRYPDLGPILGLAMKNQTPVQNSNGPTRIHD